MLITHTAYILVLWLIFLSLTAYGIYLERVKKSKYNILVFFTAVIMIVLINKTCPFVYVVENCGKYKQMVLIAPMQLKRVNLTLWDDKCYVNNISAENFYIQTLAYGDIADDELNQKAVKTTISPGEIQTVPVTKIDYIFEDLPKSIETKADGEVKYYLECSHVNK